MTSTKTMKPILPKSSLNGIGPPFHSFVSPGTTVFLVTQQGQNAQSTLQLPQGQYFLPLSSSSIVRPTLAPKMPIARVGNRYSGKISTKKKVVKVTKDKSVDNAPKQNKDIKVKRKLKTVIKPSYTTVKPILPKGQKSPEIPVFLTSTAPLTITSCLNGNAPIASILRPVIVASNITQSIDSKQNVLQQVDNSDIFKRQILNAEKSDTFKSKRSKNFNNRSKKPILNKSQKRNVANISIAYTDSYKVSAKNERNLEIKDTSSEENCNVKSHIENNKTLGSLTSSKTLFLETDSNQNLPNEIPQWPPPPPYPEQFNRRNSQDINVKSFSNTSPRIYENYDLDKSMYFHIQSESDKSKIINPLSQNVLSSPLSASNITITDSNSFNDFNKFKHRRSHQTNGNMITSKEMALDLPVAKMMAESYTSSSFCESAHDSCSYVSSTPLPYSSPSLPLGTHTPPLYTQSSSSPLGAETTYSSSSPLPISSYSNSSSLPIEHSTVQQPTYSTPITNNNNTTLNIKNRSRPHNANSIDQSHVSSYSASTYNSSLPYSEASFYQDPLGNHSTKTDTTPPHYLTMYNHHHSSSYSNSIQMSYPPLASSSSNSHFVDESTNYSYIDDYQGSYKEISTNPVTFSSQEIDKSSYFPSVRSPSPPSYHAHFQNSCYDPNIAPQQHILSPDNHSPLPSFQKCTTNYSVTCNNSHEMDPDQLQPYPVSPVVSSCSSQPHLPLPPPQPPPPPQYSSTPHRNTDHILYENYYFSETFNNTEDCTAISQDNDSFSESQNSFHNIISEPASLHHHSLSSMGYHTATAAENNSNNEENTFYNYENFPTNMTTDYYSNSLTSTPAQNHLPDGNQIEPFIYSNKVSSVEASYQHKKYASTERESPDAESIQDDSASINESLKVLLYIPEQEQNKVYQERKEKAWSLLNQAEIQTKRDSTLKEKFWIEEDEPLAEGILNIDRKAMKVLDSEKSEYDNSNSMPNSFINGLLKKKKSQYLLCQVCGQMLKGGRSLRSHLASHQSLRPHSCPYCSKRFTSKSTLKNHQRIHTGEMPFTCNICSMNFRTKSSLERHKVMHSDLRPFQCSACHKSFKTKLVLQNHVKTHIVGLFPCSTCGKTFPRQKSLLIHKASHSASARKFQCPHCSKAYQFRSLLNNHMQLHLNIRKHRCHVCNQGFVWRSSLTAHLRTHSKKRWNCDTCSRSFVSEKSYESHNCHHGVRK